MKNLIKLIELYQKMADLTLLKCKQCRVPLSCCSIEYCEIASNYAKEIYNINLQPTENKKLPFMSSHGCIVEPYLRPMCTLHVCSINSIGCDIKDPKWTKIYFELREQIDILEYEES
ncbi:MAG TPA: hypothetical protein VF849_00145 [Blattabacteriaceae bacterium]